MAGSGSGKRGWWGGAELHAGQLGADASVHAVAEGEVHGIGVSAAKLGLGDRYRAAVPAEIDPNTMYDEIWSNPPIRIGRPALHELLLTWLPRLAPDG